MSVFVQRPLVRAERGQAQPERPEVLVAPLLLLLAAQAASRQRPMEPVQLRLVAVLGYLARFAARPALLLPAWWLLG